VRQTPVQSQDLYPELPNHVPARRSESLQIAYLPSALPHDKERGKNDDKGPGYQGGDQPA